MTLNHDLALVITRVSPVKGHLNWVRPEDLATVQEHQRANVAAMHRMHQAAQPKRLSKGCYAVWSEYGTIPVNDLIGFRLEKFDTVSDAQCAFWDRFNWPGANLVHRFVELGAQEQPVMATPLSRMWIYKADPRGTKALPDYGLERGPQGGLHRVVPDKVDDEMRHIVMAEDLKARSMAGAMQEGQVF